MEVVAKEENRSTITVTMFDDKDDSSDIGIEQSGPQNQSSSKLKKSSANL